MQALRYHLGAEISKGVQVLRFQVGRYAIDGGVQVVRPTLHRVRKKREKGRAEENEGRLVRVGSRSFMILLTVKMSVAFETCTIVIPVF